MPEALTLRSANDLLADLLPARGPVRVVSRFAEGSITGAYRIEFVDADAAPTVVKIYGKHDLRSAAKEARALRFLTDHGIDISPRALAFRPSAEAVGGRPCVISSLRPGQTLTAVQDQLTPAQLQDVYRQLGDVLNRLHAISASGYGYVNGEIRNPLPDNGAHMARIFERELRRFRANDGHPALADKLVGHAADRASTFTECARPAYCHGDVHEPNLLVERTEDGAWSLTGLLDPANMHAGDPLMDLVRLDAFSVNGDAMKIAGLLSGYDIPGQHPQPGEWPDAWRSRLQLYRIALALELYNWFTISRQTSRLPTLDRRLRELVDEAA